MNVLAPADGYRVIGGGVWVVVRGGQTPEISVDGRKVDRRAEKSEDTYHLRVFGFKKEGSTVEIRQGVKTERRKVYGGWKAGEFRGFHPELAKSCGECHQVNTETCTDCHPFQDHPHKAAMADRCGACHSPAGSFPEDVTEQCAYCHKKYGANAHPRLRHPVSGENDPLRIGHRLDCASCHEPHAPKPLGELGKADLRQWCKRCHAK